MVTRTAEGTAAGAIPEREIRRDRILQGLAADRSPHARTARADKAHGGRARLDLRSSPAASSTARWRATQRRRTAPFRSELRRRFEGMQTRQWCRAVRGDRPRISCTRCNRRRRRDRSARGLDACAQHAGRSPDFGPQVAVWVESADRTRFVTTLMVTNAVALYGIGNRPGQWDTRSGPRFPYGRRPMALPVWAHARGHRYAGVVMQDGREDEITGHEDWSSPEPHFCRPMLPTKVVDAITCPSGFFRSDKGPGRRCDVLLSAARRSAGSGQQRHVRALGQSRWRGLVQLR